MQAFGLGQPCFPQPLGHGPQRPNRAIEVREPQAFCKRITPDRLGSIHARKEPFAPRCETEDRRPAMLGVRSKLGEPIAYKRVGHSLHRLPREAHPAGNLCDCTRILACGSHNLPAGWGLAERLDEPVSVAFELTPESEDVKNEFGELSRRRRALDRRYSLLRLQRCSHTSS